MIFSEAFLFAIPVVAGLPFWRRIFNERWGAQRWLPSFLVVWGLLFCVDAIGTWLQASSFIGLFVVTKYYWGGILLLLGMQWILQKASPFLWASSAESVAGTSND